MTNENSMVIEDSDNSRSRSVKLSGGSTWINMTLNGVLDVNFDGVPLGIEAFWVKHHLGLKRFDSLMSALFANRIIATYDEEGDILTLSLNSNGDQIHTQVDGLLMIGYSQNDDVSNIYMKNYC